MILLIYNKEYKIKYLILITFILSIFNFVLVINKFPFPTKAHNDSQKEIIYTILKDNGVLNKNLSELSDAILLSADAINVSPLLVIAIMKSESNFKLTAVSSKGYKSLMQTPTATMEFYDVDTLHGARIFAKKLKYCDNDLMKALILYKGGGKPSAKKQATRQAEEVYKLYTELKMKYGGTQ